MNKKISGLILSGGKSSRMGGIPKALCKINDKMTFLEKIVKTMKNAGLNDVFVVTGFHHSEIYEFCEKGLISEISGVIENKEWKKGMLSSLQCFLKFAETSDYIGVVMNLVDFPLVDVNTYKKVIESAREDIIIIPKYRGKKGHPVFWGRKFWPQFFELSLDVGPREVNKKNPEAIKYVAVEDEGIILNINTPEDYRNIFGKEVVK
jgi:molybdenum cofactor cytidylyltransferase